MSVKLVNGVAANSEATIDTNGNLHVANPTTPAQAGYTAVAGRIDAGAAGTARVKPAWVTENNSQQVAQATYFWDDTFNSTTLNTSKYKFFATTMTAAQAGGFLTLNTASSVAANVNCAVQSTRSFPLFGNSELRIIFSGGFAAGTSHSANNILELGLFQATMPGVALPLDGVFFRWNAAGELRGVINYAGTETQTAAITKPSDNVNHDFAIHVQNNVVLFLIDSEMRGSITLVTDAPTLGQPFSAATLPITMRQYIGAATPGTAMKWNCSDIFVKLIGPDTGRNWPIVKAGMGHMGYQGQNGGTVGTSAGNLANNSAPAATVPTNTTAALGSGLGGQFHETLTLVANTDGIISSFQNPAGSTTQTPRTLVISGLSISAVCSVALTVSPLAGIVTLCFGHTAVSLATAETASFTSGGVKAARRIAVGTTSLSSATSAPGTPVLGLQPYIGFTTPVVVAPGEFIAIAHKKVATAPTTGAIMWAITFDCYFE